MSDESRFNHKAIEEGLYQFWLDNNLFDPIPYKKSIKNYSIVLPPPNVTGQLHLGHAWDGCLQDTIIRYKKLKGFRTIWIPGTDHAGIATQTKYEKILKGQGIDRYKLGNEQFLKQLYDWSLSQADYIHKQWASLGFALSYKYETYTMDKNVNDLVIDTFTRLYNENLIYQDYKLVNWDVKLQTAISDIEVIHQETQSKLYYFRYYVPNTQEYYVIATTRPETMFADVAVFFNPNDKRYQHLLGKYLINPINGEPLIVKADEYIDMEFGTGLMKSTPAHDFNDYQLAIKHNIKDFKSTMNLDGTLNEMAKTKYHDFKGIDRLTARTQIVEDIKANGCLEKIEEHNNKVGYSERTGEVIEPLLSKQWFIKMKPIAESTREMIKNQKPKFIPSRFMKTMFTWFDNIQDWCISRQLLWGHRVPVYINKQTKNIHVGHAPSDIENYTQSTDVLDTWFSSGLWPLALTKYAKSPNLEDFYPNSMLVTGYDILFFWVARMFFLCGYLQKQIPLNQVFFHGLIRDAQGRKMSKSLGNGINPMDVIDKYGADALHAFLVSTATMGEDLLFSDDLLKYHANFINKLWNAYHYVSKDIQDIKKFKIKPNELKSPINKWIINEFNNTVISVTKQMDKYNFVVANKHLIDFVWETYCNKYLEYTRGLLNTNEYKDETRKVMLFIYQQALIMLHPYIPFVTERINLFFTKNKSILLAKWPKKQKMEFTNADQELLNHFNTLYACARDIRIKNSLKMSHVIEFNLFGEKSFTLIDINNLLVLFNIKVNSIDQQSSNANITTVNNIAFEIVNNFTSIEQQKEKLTKELLRLENELKRSNNILSNKNFIKNAPVDKIESERKKLDDYQKLYDLTKASLDKLK